MPIQIEDERIILYKHTCKYELIKAIALDVKNNCNNDISEEEKYRMQERLALIGMYKTRNPEEKPLDAINHRINTLQYWMFGYKYKIDRTQKFIFSPLGNLFIKHIEDACKLQKIFIAMLFAMQFPHPGSGTPHKFNLYLFRLIFKLLLDNRLEGKLYNQEYECILAFLETIDIDSYEFLVENILKMRTKSNEELIYLLKKKEHTYVNNIHEWETFTQTLFEQIGLIKKHNGDFLCKLYHPSNPGSKSLPTGRNATRGYITLNSSLVSFISLLLEKYRFDEKPLSLNDKERLEIDIVKEIYNFYPKELLEEIGEYNPIIDELLKLPKLIEQYATNETQGDCYKFEETLTDGFNMFYNVDAKWRGGAGNTDIECLYEGICRKKKFAVDGKSTANKLSSLNAGRLRGHREKIGGKYTIVITPKYVPAVKQDIYNEPIVIITSSTFAEYLYNCISHNVREIDYAEFDEIIMNNLGTDISKKISDLTLEKFGACA